MLGSFMAVSPGCSDDHDWCRCQSNAWLREQVAGADVLAGYIALPLFGRPSQRADQACVDDAQAEEWRAMNSIIYVVGLVVIVAAMLSFLGMR